MSVTDQSLTPQSLFFCICSAAGSGGETWVLSATEGRVLLLPWQGTMGQQWQLVDAGPAFAIMPAAGGGGPLYLAPVADDAGQGLTLSTTSFAWVVPPAWNAEAQKVPDYRQEGSLFTPGTSRLAITVDGMPGAGGAEVSLQPVQPGAPAQSWWLLPQALSEEIWEPPWERIECALTDDEQNRYFLEASLGQGALSPVLALRSDSPLQMWRFTPDGHLLNRFGYDIGALVLAVDLSASGPEVPCVVVPWHPTDLSQEWTWQGTPGQGRALVNVQNPVLGLTVAGGAAAPGAAVVGATLQAPPGLSQLFERDPLPVLETILSMAPQPFAIFTGGQNAAYAYILAQLGVSSLRQQYLNVRYPLQNYVNELLRLQRPAGIDPADWSAVVADLSAELNDAIATRRFFDGYHRFHTNQLLAQSVTWQQAINDAGMVEGTQQTNGVAIAVLSGIVSTALRFIPVAGGILSNVFNSAVRIATATGDVTLAPSPFSVTVSEVWQQLLQSFDRVLAYAAAEEAAILSDRGKLAALAAATRTTGRGSLAGDPSTAEHMDAAVTAAFLTGAMQILLPAKFCIYVSSAYVPDDVPEWAAWQDHENDETRWIAELDAQTVYPVQQVMADALAADGDLARSAFFHARAGWNFTVQRLTQSFAYQATITVSNGTSDSLQVNSSVAANLLPYHSVLLALQTEWGNDLEQAVTILSVVEGAVIASFNVVAQGQLGSSGYITGYTLSLANLVTTGRYVFSSPDVPNGFSAQIGIYKTAAG